MVGAQGERCGGGDVGELGWVSDEVDAGDETVLDTDRHDAVDLAVNAQEECRIAVDGGRLAGERAFLAAEAGEEEADHLRHARDGP